MSKGDHRTNDAYLDSALWQHPTAVMRKYLPPVSVSIEEDGADYILITDTGKELMRFPINSDLAWKLRRYGGLLEIKDQWKTVLSLIAKTDNPADFIGSAAFCLKEIQDIKYDFEITDEEIGEMINWAGFRRRDRRNDQLGGIPTMSEKELREIVGENNWQALVRSWNLKADPKIQEKPLQMVTSTQFYSIKLKTGRLWIIVRYSSVKNIIYYAYDTV